MRISDIYMSPPLLLRRVENKTEPNAMDAGYRVPATNPAVTTTPATLS